MPETTPPDSNSTEDVTATPAQPAESTPMRAAARRATLRRANATPAAQPAAARTSASASSRPTKKQAPVGGALPRGNAETIWRMEQLLEDFAARRKAMSGSVCWCLDANGEMFTAVWDATVAVRVGAEEAARLIASHEGRVFEVKPGRPMLEYVLVPASTLRDEQLRAWVERAAAYAGELPVKAKK